MNNHTSAGSAKALLAVAAVNAREYSAWAIVRPDGRFAINSKNESEVAAWGDVFGAHGRLSQARIDELKAAGYNAVRVTVQFPARPS